jgi:hypothetical protein
MDKERLEDYLKTIPKPEPALPEEQQVLKIALLSARKSSRIGLLLVGLPGVVVLLFIFQQTFLVPVTVRWPGAIFIFSFLIGSPLLAVFLNLLSLCYFHYDKERKEFHMTFRIRWWNILITLAGGGLATFFILQLLAGSIPGGR